MEKNRNIFISAYLSLIFGQPRTFLSTFFGVFASLICWVAISDGAPMGFIVAPVVFGLVALSPVLSVSNRYALISRGILTKAKVERSQGQNVFVNMREIHVSTLSFLDETGVRFEFNAKVTKPKEFSRDKTDPTEAGASIAIVYLPDKPSTALLQRDLGPHFIFTERDVRAPFFSTTVLLLPTLLFILINIFGSWFVSQQDTAQTVSERIDLDKRSAIWKSHTPKSQP